MTAHILVIEDEVKLARFIELELSSEGYEVTVAIDTLRSKDTEILLTDLD